MNIDELIELVEEKIDKQDNFICAVAPLSWEQQVLCDQAKMQYLWFIEKLKLVNKNSILPAVSVALRVISNVNYGYIGKNECFTVIQQTNTCYRIVDNDGKKRWYDKVYFNKQ